MTSTLTVISILLLIGAQQCVSECPNEYTLGGTDADFDNATMVIMRIGYNLQWQLACTSDPSNPTFTQRLTQSLENQLNGQVAFSAVDLRKFYNDNNKLGLEFGYVASRDLTILESTNIAMAVKTAVEKDALDISGVPAIDQQGPAKVGYNPGQTFVEVTDACVLYNAKSTCSSPQVCEVKNDSPVCQEPVGCPTEISLSQITDVEGPRLVLLRVTFDDVYTEVCALGAGAAVLLNTELLPMLENLYDPSTGEFVWGAGITVTTSIKRVYKAPNDKVGVEFYVQLSQDFTDVQRSMTGLLGLRAFNLQVLAYNRAITPKIALSAPQVAYLTAQNTTYWVSVDDGCFHYNYKSLCSENQTCSAGSWPPTCGDAVPCPTEISLSNSNYEGDDFVYLKVNVDTPYDCSQGINALSLVVNVVTPKLTAIYKNGHNWGTSSITANVVKVYKQDNGNVGYEYTVKASRLLSLEEKIKIALIGKTVFDKQEYFYDIPNFQRVSAVSAPQMAYLDTNNNPQFVMVDGPCFFHTAKKLCTSPQICIILSGEDPVCKSPPPGSCPSSRYPLTTGDMPQTGDDFVAMRLMYNYLWDCEKIISAGYSLANNIIKPKINAVYKDKEWFDQVEMRAFFDGSLGLDLAIKSKPGSELSVEEKSAIATLLKIAADGGRLAFTFEGVNIQLSGPPQFAIGEDLFEPVLNGCSFFKATDVCKNEGTCSLTDDTPTCTCQKGFSAPYCKDRDRKVLMVVLISLSVFAAILLVLLVVLCCRRMMSNPDGEPPYDNPNEVKKSPHDPYGPKYGPHPSPGRRVPESTNTTMESNTNTKTVKTFQPLVLHYNPGYDPNSGPGTMSPPLYRNVDRTSAPQNIPPPEVAPSASASVMVSSPTSATASVTVSSPAIASSAAPINGPATTAENQNGAPKYKVTKMVEKGNYSWVKL